MKILISPAKTMRTGVVRKREGEPVFLEKTREILESMRKLSYDEAKVLWKCNDKLAQLNYKRIQEMDLKNGTAAIFLYDGLQFKAIETETLTRDEAEYMTSHLRILSGFYGVLRPFDGITTYRLEMQSRLQVGDAKTLYDFWGRQLYEMVMDEDRTLINLASREYISAVSPWLTNQDRIITVEFLTEREGKRRQESTYAKMGRGRLVRFMAENQVETVEAIQDFSALGFHFDAEHSSDTRYVFVRHGEAK